MLHHKALGKAFEVWCLHVPIYDRTPFEGLVKFVESTVRRERASSPDKPIYMLGDSFGGCLALAVAARNPTIDLVLILVNPSTSYSRSQLQCLLPIAESLPDGLKSTILCLLNFAIGDPLKVAMVNSKSGCLAEKRPEQFLGNLINLLQYLCEFSDDIPKDTFLWKLKLLKCGATYVNSRLHAVKAEVLVLASGKDSLFPSQYEAQRLSSLIQNCKFRYFKESKHSLLLEDGINLLTVIKGTFKYRRSRKQDHISDFIPPSMSEYKYTFERRLRIFRLGVSPAMFSTLEDGKIVSGLRGVPSEGPVLLVGYHMLFGIEITLLVHEFLSEKNVIVRGMAHPEMFTKKFEDRYKEFSLFDLFNVFGAVPVSARNLMKLLSTKSHVLLYPGGIREALHRKGESYKLFWPDQPEFVKIAAKFGATIVPFGVVGVDDVAELLVDYNDQMKIPFVNDQIRRHNRGGIRLRTKKGGEISKEDFYVPGFCPKIPGRFYFLFGKPIETKGREDMLRDKHYLKDFYMQIKADVEKSMEYLIKKREEDPYRGIIERMIYRAVLAPENHVPSFEP